MRSARTGWVRVGAVLLVALVYVGVWRPVRVLLVEHVAAPLVVEAGAAVVQPLGTSLGVRGPDGGAFGGWTAPAGMPFLLAALVLVGLFPTKPYTLWLWGGHGVLSALSLGALLLALHGVGWALLVQRFLDTYLLNAVTLGAMALGVVAARGVAVRADAASSPSPLSIHKPTHPPPGL